MTGRCGNGCVSWRRNVVGSAIAAWATIMTNIAIITGRIARDPDTRETKGGTNVTGITVVTDRPAQDKDGKTYKDENGYTAKESEFHRVTCFNGLAKTVGQYCSKGQLVSVQGRKRGKRFRFDPARIRAGKGDQNLTLHEPRKLEIHKGDRIRWTRNDHRRGLFNADQARVVAVVGGKVTFETSKGDQVELKKDDPMLKRIDLAYALNAHMAQGLTSDRGIAVMDSRERNLSNQKTFLVTITRLRDHLTLVVDSSDRLGAAVARNKGEKASALEVTAQVVATEKNNGELDRPKPEEANKAEKELARSKSKTLDFGI